MSKQERLARLVKQHVFAEEVEVYSMLFLHVYAQPEVDMLHTLLIQRMRNVREALAPVIHKRDRRGRYTARGISRVEYRAQGDHL